MEALGLLLGLMALATFIAPWVALIRISHTNSRVERLESDLARLGKELAAGTPVKTVAAHEATAAYKAIKPEIVPARPSPLAVETLFEISGGVEELPPALPPQTATSAKESFPAIPAQPTAEPVAPPAISLSRLQVPDINFEHLLGTRGLVWAGIIMSVIAGGLFLKWMLDENVIGPMGRVMLWTGASTLALVLGEMARRQRYAPLFQALTGGGIAGYYTCIYFAMHVLHLATPETSMLLATGVTFFAIALAVLHNTQPIALMAIGGGLLSPLLFSTGENRPYAFFSYVLVLSAVALGASLFRRWRWVNQTAFAGAWLLFGMWFVKYHEAPDQLQPALIFCTAFYVFFSMVASVYSLTKREAGTRVEVGLAIANTAAALAAYCDVLMAHHRMTLGFVVLGQALLTLGLYQLWIQRIRTDKPMARTLLVLAIALTFLAVPLQAKAYGIPLAWAAEALALAAAGYWLKDRVVRACGGAAALLSVGGLVVRLPLHKEAVTFILNGPFLSWSAVTIAWGGIAWFWFRTPEDGTEERKPMFAAAALGTLGLALVTSSMEIGYWWYNRQPAWPALWYPYMSQSLLAFWSVLAMALCVVLYKVRRDWLHAPLALVLLLPMAAILMHPEYRSDTGTLFFSTAFGAYALVAAAWVLAAWTLGRITNEELENREVYFPIAALGALALTLIFFSMDIGYWWYWRREAWGNMWSAYTCQSLLAFWSLFIAGLGAALYRLRREWIPVPMVLALALALVALLMGMDNYRAASGVLFFNTAFGAYLLVLGSIGLTAWFCRVVRHEVPWSAVVEVIGECLLGVVLAMELYRCSVEGGAMDKMSAIALISAAWAMLALVLVVAGLLGRATYRRYLGFAIFGLTIGKVVLMDSAMMEQSSRIISWMACGILLVVAGYAYNRFSAVLLEEEKTDMAQP